MDHFIPLSIPNFEGNEKKYVDDALAQGWVSTGGAYVSRLERQLEEYLQAEKVAACQSGTAALHLALAECGVGPGDLVIAPTLTFIAAVNPIRYQFADPVFMDCDDSLCMDPVKLRRFCERECRISRNKLIHRDSGRTVKALVVVHVFGNLADMEAIMDVAEEFHLKVVEDATEALGSRFTQGRYAGKYAGTIGDFGAYSFNGNKIITTGGGGAVTGRDASTVEHLKYLSTQAKDDPRFYLHGEVGYNYRMTNLQAALGVAQMEELEEFISRKHRNHKLYQELFSEFPHGRIKDFREGTRSNQWFYSLELSGMGSGVAEEETGKCGQGRGRAFLRKLIADLQERGIQSRAVWGLIHEQPPYQGCTAYYIAQASYYGGCILNLPCSTQLSEAEIRYVARQTQELLCEEMGDGGNCHLLEV